jgi:DMSO/TMAO reductase YedYZ molybdopterin-dependent catalytic subunit
VTMENDFHHEDERTALVRLDPEGFFIRHPRPPESFKEYITTEDDLFQTIHMGAAVVDHARWRLVITGLVAQPMTMNLAQLQARPATTVTAFHECYGSPIQPPTKNVLRIGNVKWTGVRLRDLLADCQPLPQARFIVSDGLDRGTFSGVSADRYQKDLLLGKALSPEVLVAYKMNGKPLSKNRGGPIRLVVPGWFGTNSTKWLCKLTLTESRASGPYTTRFYNEIDPLFDDGRLRPVWEVEPNSLIVSPADGCSVPRGVVAIKGWAWANEGINRVVVTIEAIEDQQGETATRRRSSEARLEDREDFSWQHFEAEYELCSGQYKASVRASSKTGVEQPLQGRRNHVHAVEFTVRTNENP